MSLALRRVAHDPAAAVGGEADCVAVTSARGDGRGKVYLHCLALAEEVQITISDSGPAVSAEQLGNVFDRYWQARREHLDGTGLGLFIAKGIAEVHGGRIWAEIRPEAGATFVFTLPILTKGALN